MNNLKPDRPKTVQDQLDDLMGQTGRARRAGDSALCQNLRAQARGLIPDPKTAWNFHPQTIAPGTVETLPAMGECDRLDLWLDRMDATRFDLDRQSEYSNLVAGHALFQCGRKDNAPALFKHVLANHCPKWFSDKYRPYLDLAEAP